MFRRCVGKKAIAWMLSLFLMLSLFTTPAYAAEKTALSGADYPIVLVHGMLGWGDEDRLTDILPYWGVTSGNMVSYLRLLGYDVSVASVGPISSIHDRCCELFAELTGTRVDYGQAHADQSTAEFAANGYTLTHQRYGRDYAGKAIAENWGPIFDASGKVTDWYQSKINLVGHSFGGPTMLEFVHLLAEGDADEQAWGKEQAALYGGDWHDYVSPLFWGDYDGEYLINSVTSIAGVLNGTSFISANSDIMPAISRLLVLAANAVGVSDLAAYYDCQLEQFGLSHIPGSDAEAQFSYLARRGFLSGSDYCLCDLSIAGANRLKQGWATYPNIYYFSYACLSSYQEGDAWVSDSSVPAILAELADPMGVYTNPDEKILSVDGTVYGCVDEQWLPNDCQVNVISSRYPLGAAHQAYNAKDIRPGTWNVHPDLAENHFSVIGSFIHPDPVGTRALFRGIGRDISRTTPVEQNSQPDTPAVPYVLQLLLRVLRLPLRFFGFSV